MLAGPQSMDVRAAVDIDDLPTVARAPERVHAARIVARHQSPIERQAARTAQGQVQGYLMNATVAAGASLAAIWLASRLLLNQTPSGSMK